MTTLRTPGAFADWLARELATARSPSHAARAGRPEPTGAAEREMLDRLFAFAMEFILWWHEAGVVFYGRSSPERDDGLRLLAADAVRVVGGWRRARDILRQAPHLNLEAERATRSRIQRGIVLRGGSNGEA